MFLFPWLFSLHNITGKSDFGMVAIVVFPFSFFL